MKLIFADYDLDSYAYDLNVEVSDDNELSDYNPENNFKEIDIKEYAHIFGEEVPNKKQDVKRIGIFSNSELVGYGSMRIERVICGV